jgi:hypothetical protein
VTEFQLPGSLTIVAGVLFIRSMGTSAVGILSIWAAYASAQRENPPVAGSESVKPFVLWPPQRLTPNPQHLGLTRRGINPDAIAALRIS